MSFGMLSHFENIIKKKPMKNFIFLFVATFVAFSTWAQSSNTESYIDSTSIPTHMNTLAYNRVWNPTTDSAFYTFERSLDGVNFASVTDTTGYLGQGMTSFTKLVPLVANTVNHIRMGSWTQNSSSVSYDTITVLTPDTPQTVTIIDFPQTDSSANSVTANFMWQGGDTVSTVYVEYGYTSAASDGSINFPITGSGSMPVTISGLLPDTMIYTRSYVVTPGFAWSGTHPETMYTGVIVSPVLTVAVDTSLSPFEALATVNVTVGDCDSLTVTPTLYDNNGPVQSLQDSIFTSDGVWTFPIPGLSSSTEYSLEVTGTSNCAAVTETAIFVSQVQQGLEIVAFSNIILGQDQLQSTISFDPNLALEGTVTGTVQDLLSGVVDYTFSLLTYLGPGSRSETVTVQPGTGKIVSWQYADPTGVYQAVTVSDTIFMPPVPMAMGWFQGGANPTKHSFSQSFWVFPNGNWSASATTMHFSLSLMDDTNAIELVLQDSVDLITVSGLQTIACNNLENSQFQGLGSEYRLVVWLVNGGGVTEFFVKTIQLLPPTNPNLVLQEFVEVSGNQVRSKIYVEANGNHIVPKYGLEVNGILFTIWGDTLGSAADTTVVVTHGPYDNCDLVRFQVAGIVASGLFNPPTPLNNLQETIEINCIEPSSVAEDLWDGLVITSESVTLPSGVSEVELQIVSMLGQVVLQRTFSGSSSFSLEPGAYVYRLVTTDGHVMARKIAKL